MPIPANALSVVPPTWHAASPVVAATNVVVRGSVRVSSPSTNLSNVVLPARSPQPPPRSRRLRHDGRVRR